MAARPVRYRRSPHVVCYWRDGDMVAFNFATGTDVVTTPEAWRALSFFDTWRSPRAVLGALEPSQQKALLTLLDDLVGASLLERSDLPRDARSTAMDAWSSWNPAAGFFHGATRDIPYTKDFRAGERQWRKRLGARPMPPPVKHYPKAPRTALPQPALEGDFVAALKTRRTWREFGRGPVNVRDLATLLQLTWGVQQWGHAKGLGDVVLKTSPSGGARHAEEVYVLALNVSGLPRGLYHYAADTHTLERLKRGSGARQVARYLPGQPWFTSAGALLLMTAVFPREQWRYDTPRAYRAVLIEAGHLCQTFCLLATSLGLAPFSTMALADAPIEHDLGVDGITESVIYAAGVGVRPAHGWKAGARLGGGTR